MIRMEFSSVSASEAGDYFQVLFEDDEGKLELNYFLLQCQFEDPLDEGFYIESTNTQLCGHVKIETAVLSSHSLRLEIPSTEWKNIQIEFAGGSAGLS